MITTNTDTDNYNILVENEGKSEKEIILSYIFSEINEKDLNYFKEYALLNNSLQLESLENWRIEEIIQIVKEYKEINSDFYNMESRIEVLGKSNDSFIRKPENKRSLSIIRKHSSYIDCRKMKESTLSLYDNLHISISNPTVVETPFYQQNYIQYEINTVELGWIVNRRYTDFENYQQILKILFPGCFIPPLPTKKIMKRFDSKYIKKRMLFLNDFLKEVIENEKFKKHEVTSIFLSVADRELYDIKIKSYLSAEETSNIHEYLSLTDKIPVNYEVISESYFRNMKTFNEINRKIILNIKEESKKYEESIKMAYLSIDQIQKNFQNLSDLYKKSEIKEPFSVIFNELEKFSSVYKIGLYKNMSSFRDNINRNLFKIHLENQMLDEILVKREEIKEEYEKMIASLNNKREELWEKKNYSEWDLNPEAIHEDLNDKDNIYKYICYNDSLKVDNEYKKLGFFNYQCSIEQMKLIEYQYSYMFNNVKIFLNDYYDSIQNGINIWSNFNMMLSL